jgi:hypothetical protein
MKYQQLKKVDDKKTDKFIYIKGMRDPDSCRTPGRKMHPMIPNFFVELIFSFINIARYSNLLAGLKWPYLEAR